MLDSLQMHRTTLTRIVVDLSDVSLSRPGFLQKLSAPDLLELDLALAWFDQQDAAELAGMVTTGYTKLKRLTLRCRMIAED